MATKDEASSSENLLQELLERARDTYIEKNGEEPPEEFMNKARRIIVQELASSGREEHRDVYDALADE